MMKRKKLGSCLFVLFNFLREPFWGFIFVLFSVESVQKSERSYILDTFYTMSNFVAFVGILK